MKKKFKQLVAFMILIVAFLIYNTPAVNAQISTNSDAIIGKWQNPDATRRMEIYKSGNQYFGKIIWIKSDDGNVKVGDVIIKNLSFSSNQWNGTAIAKGNKLDCLIVMTNNNSISIKGKKGFVSRTKVWTRIQ